MACMAHARRKFVDIFQSQGLEIAEEAIKRIALLYKVEKAAREKPPEERVALRQRDAKPVFDELETWLDAQLNRISGKSELAKAIRYALGRMKKMRGYLTSGSLELDNTSAERSIRCVALGRKISSLWAPRAVERLRPSPIPSLRPPNSTKLILKPGSHGSSPK